MNTSELEKKWNEKAAELFKQFVTEEIGLNEQKLPACYKTGDDHIYCYSCPYKPNC